MITYENPEMYKIKLKLKRNPCNGLNVRAGFNKSYDHLQGLSIKPVKTDCISHSER